MILIITGEVKCGKTTLVKQLVEKLENIKLWGFVTPSIFDKGRVVGYVAEILPTNKSFLLVSTSGEGEKVGRFVLLNEGKKALFSELERLKGDFFIFDEFGPLELRGGGLRSLFNRFLESGKSGVVVVRKRILDVFLRDINQPYMVFDAEKNDSINKLLEEIKKLLRGGM